MAVPSVRGVQSQKPATVSESPSAFDETRPFTEHDKDLDDAAVYDSFSLPNQIDKFDHLSSPGGGFLDEHDSFASIDLGDNMPEFEQDDMNAEADNV